MNQMYQQPQQYMMNPSFMHMYMPQQGTYSQNMDFQQAQFMQMQNMQRAPQSNSMVSNEHNTLYIGDLDEQIEDQYLFSQIMQNGKNPILCRVAKDPYTKKSKGFAFAQFLTKSDAQYIKEKMNHQKIFQKSIRIYFVSDKKKKNDEANIIVKNIPNGCEPQEIEAIFKEYGPIYSVKMGSDGKGNHLNYAFVQFEEKKCADQCIEKAEQNAIQIKGTDVFIEHYQKAQFISNDNKNNLYIKNLPKDKSEQEILEKLIEKFQPLGQINSKIVKFDHEGKPFAFVCFDKSENAQEVYHTFQAKDIFECGLQLEINWHQKKEERKKLIQDALLKDNQSNLITKNLLPDVTKEILQEQYQQFGKIISCLVQVPKDSKLVNLRQGYIKYETKDEAVQAIVKANKIPSIRELYKDQNVSIAPLIPKSVIDQYKKTKLSARKPNTKQYNSHLLNGGEEQNQQGQQMPYFDQQQMYMMMQQFMNMMSMMYNQQQFYGQPAPKQFTNKFPYQQNQYSAQRNNQYQKFQPGQQQQQMQRPNIPFTNQQQKPQVPKQFQQSTTSDVRFATAKEIRKNLQAFQQFTQDQQRLMLGELLFPKIQRLIKPDQMARVPKITGMLIDFTVFDVAEILDMFENDEDLNERIQEAQQLIDGSEHQN